MVKSTLKKTDKPKKRIHITTIAIVASILAVVIAIISAFFLWDRPNILIDIIAIIVAAAGLIAIGVGYRKAGTRGSTLGVGLIIATLFILVLSVYYDVKKEAPPEIGSIEISGSKIAVFFKSLNDVNPKCKESTCSPKDSQCNPCAECIGPTFLSRDWQNSECQAIKIVSHQLERIRLKSLEDPKAAFNEFEIYRKEIIRKIETSFDAHPADRTELQAAIAELVVLDQLTFNVIKEYIKP